MDKAKKALQKEEKLANDKRIAHANGKVLHCDDQKRKNFVCSAAAIDSPAKRVVVTTAHCVYAEKNRCFSNWVFIPGYDDGKKPYGTFQAQRFHALRDYIHRGDDAGSDWNSDVAFVTTKDSEQGRRLVDAVGGHKLVTGKTTEFNATVFGCPTISTGAGPCRRAARGPRTRGSTGSVASIPSRDATCAKAYFGGPRFNDRAKKSLEEANGDKWPCTSRGWQRKGSRATETEPCAPSDSMRRKSAGRRRAAPFIESARRRLSSRTVAPFRALAF